MQIEVLPGGVVSIQSALTVFVLPAIVIPPSNGIPRLRCAGGEFVERPDRCYLYMRKAEVERAGRKNVTARVGDWSKEEVRKGSPENLAGEWTQGAKGQCVRFKGIVA